MRVKTGFMSRRGQFCVVEFASLEAALQRLAWLDEQEARTRELAPTDSGSVRFDYRAESEGIRAAIR